jgi:hypothetical protein
MPSQQTTTLRKDVQATLKRLEKKDPGLRQFLNDAYGYAVFPSVGKAALVIGGAYGKGAVFEDGEMIGYATIAQTTIGVQLGGDTFAEIIAFESKEALDRFKKGRMAFAANASAVLVKAGAAGTADYEKGVSVFAYASGGMLLEAAIGGQKFKFKPLSEEEQGGGRGAQSKKGNKGRQQRSGDDDDQGDSDESSGGGTFGLIGKAAGGVKNAGSKVTDLIKEHPVAATLIGVGLASGIALLAARSLVSSSSSGQEDEQDEDQDSDESDEDQGDESSDEDESDEDEDSGSDEGEGDDEGDEEDEDQDDDDEGDQEEEGSSSRRRRARA